MLLFCLYYLNGFVPPWLFLHLSKCHEAGCSTVNVFHYVNACIDFPITHFPVSRNSLGRLSTTSLLSCLFVDDDDDDVDCCLLLLECSVLGFFVLVIVPPFVVEIPLLF